MLKNTLGCLAVGGAILVAFPGMCFAWGRAEMDAHCAAINATFSTSSQRCVCNSGFTESGDTCVRSGGGSSPSYDYGAAAREQERLEAERRAEEQRQHEAELERQRREEDNRRRLEEIARQAKFLEDRDAAASTLRGSTGANATLRGLGGSGLRISGFDAGGGSVLRDSIADNRPVLRGSGTGPELRGVKSATMSAPNLDPMVVDARVAPMGANLLSQVPELERSPAADRIRKGFQAVMNVPRDWPVALAWWQEALQLDPGNAALVRSVDLAQWMVDSKKRAASRQPTSYPALDAYIRGDLTEFNRLIDLAKTNNALQAADAEWITSIVNKQLKQRAAEPPLSKSPTSATMAQMAAVADRSLSEQMFEDGLLYDLVGNHEAAVEAFRRADFQRMFDGGEPFYPIEKTTKAPSKPMAGNQVQVPTDSDLELLFGPKAAPLKPAVSTKSKQPHN